MRLQYSAQSDPRQLCGRARRVRGATDVGAAGPVRGLDRRRRAARHATVDGEGRRPRITRRSTRRKIMRRLHITIAVLVLSSLASIGHADPLITRGIGLSNCGKLVKDLKPSEGLDHMPNALLFYWVQGYMSAANIYLLNEYTNYVDLNTADENRILKTVADFCKANPNKTPISAIDALIRKADKIDVDEKDVFDPWEQ